MPILPPTHDLYDIIMKIATLSAVIIAAIAAIIVSYVYLKSKVKKTLDEETGKLIVVLQGRLEVAEHAAEEAKAQATQNSWRLEFLIKLISRQCNSFELSENDFGCIHCSNHLRYGKQLDFQDQTGGV
jgi:hypothetical protein